MAQLETLEICRIDLFTAQEELQQRYTDDVVERILRIREEYNWFIANPDAKDRQFIENAVSRFGIHKSSVSSRRCCPTWHRPAVTSIAIATTR